MKQNFAIIGLGRFGGKDMPNFGGSWSRSFGH